MRGRRRRILIYWVSLTAIGFVTFVGSTGAPSSEPRDRPAAAPSTPAAGRTPQTPVPAG